LRHEFLPGEDTGKQSHGGSGIAGVKSAARALQSSQAMPGDLHGISINLTSAPSAFMQSSVLWQSAAAAKWRNSLAPSARAAIIAYRWEMDLSPGGSTPPESVLAGRMVRFFTLEF